MLKSKIPIIRYLTLVLMEASPLPFFLSKRVEQKDRVYLAVIAVLGVLMACSMVFGLPVCIPGRRKPDTGRPDCERGL